MKGKIFLALPFVFSASAHHPPKEIATLVSNKNSDKDTIIGESKVLVK